jgi:hypothetical protein
MNTGSCLCGAVGIAVEGGLPAPVACHCGQCRRQSGHYWASTDLPRDRVTITGAEHVTWYHASEPVRRGFCAICGAFLFWEPLGQDRIAVAMGAFDAPTGTRLERHIFTADKGDYYDITDGLPQNPQ